MQGIAPPVLASLVFALAALPGALGCTIEKDAPTYWDGAEVDSVCEMQASNLSSCEILATDEQVAFDDCRSSLRELNPQQTETCHEALLSVAECYAASTCQEWESFAGGNGPAPCTAEDDEAAVTCGAPN